MSVEWSSEDLAKHQAKKRLKILPDKPKNHERVQKLRVPQVGPSLNTYKRNMKRPLRKGELAATWARMIKELVKDQNMKPVEEYPVEVIVECYFGPSERGYNWFSLSPTPKLIHDGLKAAGIIKQASPAYVKSGTMVPLKTEEESYTLFYIIEPFPMPV